MTNVGVCVWPEATNSSVAMAIASTLHTTHYTNHLEDQTRLLI